MFFTFIFCSILLGVLMPFAMRRDQICYRHMPTEISLARHVSRGLCKRIVKRLLQELYPADVLRIKLVFCLWNISYIISVKCFQRTFRLKCIVLRHIFRRLARFRENIGVSNIHSWYPFSQYLPMYMAPVSYININICHHILIHHIRLKCITRNISALACKVIWEYHLQKNII